MDPHLDDALSRLGHVGRRAEFLRAGSSPAALVTAWKSGDLVRVRHGVYARPGLSTDVMRAVRVGGVLAGPSAARVLGLWKVPGAPLHVSVRSGAAGLRDPDDGQMPLDRRRADVRVLHDGHRLSGWERAHVGLRNCLRQSLTLVEPRFGVAVLDSALRAGLLDGDKREVVRGDLPRRCRALLDFGDDRRESGTESIMAWGLHEAGIPFTVQVATVPYRIDFALPHGIVVECTSKEHHGSPEQYSRDRRRIADLVRRGYFVLEFTYAQVIYEWPLVLATIRAALAHEGVHGVL